ncbi:DUF4160 domain-containing protein [Leptolyngbya sp. PCC 6406]|uniref:DUF4160 domain-containing protein n=1 Tax=Leptolyngbya sp. PCC 6406 TaxID=1173264 RepID=UPI0002AC4654|nr:DUF4160 domain-containing protein [Leptolyngbya sp. PCC 6406]
MKLLKQDAVLHLVWASLESPIERDQAEAKFWLTPVPLHSNKGFSRKEINPIQKQVEENQE